jgi:pyruvate, water dikinase
LLGLFAATAIAAAAVMGLACGDTGKSQPAPDGGPDGPDGGGTGPGVPFLTELATPADLAALTASDLGDEVKYLAPIDGRPPPPALEAPCMFQNMRRYSWHLLFLQSFPAYAGLSYDGYLGLVLRPASRRLWGGAVRPWPAVLHPTTGAPGIVAYTVYGDPGSVSAAAVREVDGRLKGCIPFARDLLVFVPGSPDQIGMLMTERAALAAAGVASLFPEDLVAGVSHLPHSRGEGYGTLRIVPAGQPLASYGPRDVVIVESAPVDISIVAGLITRNPQNDLGHVNLRLREKRIPNVTVPRIYEAAWARALDGLLVHLEVTAETFTLEPARLADAEAFWEANRPHVRAPEADLGPSALVAFGALGAAGARAYGAKAANLGELARILEPPNRNAGFGIPFSRYRDFVRDQGIDADIEALVSDPQVRTDADVKRARLAALRDRIRRAPFPAPLASAIAAAVTEVYGPGGPNQFLRFRSSTNVEDLDAFTGAGLYDSKTGCLGDDLDGDGAGPSACFVAHPDERAAEEAELGARRAELAAHPERTWLGPVIADLEEDLADERTVAGAVRKVWASLWNERAFDERTHYGIDHRLAYMGIAVNPTFITERANAVAVSNLDPGDGGPPLYRLNSQMGTESVVRPEDPTAVAELLTFRRVGLPPQAADVTVQLESSRLPPGGRVWPDDKLAALARLLFRVQDHFAANVYPQISPLHLDYELKLGAGGDVVVKQVRPFVDNQPR